MQINVVKIGDARLPSMQKYMARKEELGRYTLPTLQKRIRDYVPAIKSGDLRVVYKILEIVRATDQAKPILTTARKALACVSAAELGQDDYRQFGFPARKNAVYYLGALFELLPRDIALKLFVAQHPVTPFYKPTYIRAAHVLLQFSSEEKALEFVKDLIAHAPEHKNIFHYLSRRRPKEVRDYPQGNFSPPSFLDKLI